MVTTSLSGGNFQNVTVGWQYSWLGRPNKHFGKKQKCSNRERPAPAVSAYSIHSSRYWQAEFEEANGAIRAPRHY